MSQSADGLWYGTLGAAVPLSVGGDPVPPADHALRHTLVYDGELRELYRLFFRNLLVILATGGVYYFWGKVRLRQYLWSRLSLDGYRLEFRGRGGEMFKGFLMILCGLAIWGVGTTVIELSNLGQSLLIRLALGVATFLVILFLAFVAQFSAQRYRLTRTRWRGIGGSMRGSALVYALKAMAMMALVGISLFQARPYVSLRLLEHRLNRVSIGDRPVTFAGCQAGAIYGRYLLGCFGVVAVTIVLSIGLGVFAYFVFQSIAVVLYTLGLQTVSGILSYVLLTAASTWVMAGFWSRYWNHAGPYIAWGNVTLEINSTRKMFVRHRVVHFLAIVFSLGLAYPWALHRVTGFLTQSVVLRGDLALNELKQSDLSGAAIGEGLLNAFDPGFI
jgi:uncharacterized membrane protein YjgN (DUF898 family)